MINTNIITSPYMMKNSINCNSRFSPPKDKDATEIDLIEFKDAPFVMMEEGQFLYNVTHYLCKKKWICTKNSCRML